MAAPPQFGGPAIMAKIRSLVSESSIVPSVNDKPIFYARDGGQCDRLLQAHVLDCNVTALGFDTETRPSHMKGQHNRVALVQLYTGQCSLVLHIIHFVLSTGELKERCHLSEEDTFAALIAGMIHDYDHPGYS